MLAKFVLSTLPFYSMQIARIHRIVCDELDCKTRKFVWEGDDENSRVHLVHWETLQKLKNGTRLRIQAMRQANAAFFTKLGCRLLAKVDSLWSRVN